MNRYRVAVFTHETRRGRRYLAYLRVYNPAWDGCCLHEVEAEEGRRAKQVAIREHRQHCVEGPMSDRIPSPPAGGASQGITEGKLKKGGQNS